MNRPILWLLLGVAVLCMPASCVTALMVLNIANPMAVAFLTSVTVRNNSGEPVHITPVGTVGREGHRRLLPLSNSARFSISAPTASDFYLEPGQERRFTYDWDDINFSEIAVRDQRGTWRQVVVDPTPTKRQYHRPSTDLFLIPPLSELPEATEAVRTAAARPNSRVSTLWWLAAFGVLPPALLVFCLKRLRAARLPANTPTP